MTEADHFDPSLVEGLYAKTKAEATQLVLDAADGGLNACVVHPSGILGPNDNGRGHMTQLVLDYAAGRLRACVKGGYDFVDVRDVAEGILACCEKGERGQCYILSGRFVSVRELMELLHQETGHKRIRTVLPWWLARLFAAPAALYYKIRRQPPLFTRYSLYTLRANAQFSYEKAEHFLGYHARPTEATVRDTVRWLASMGRIKLETP